MRFFLIFRHLILETNPLFISCLDILSDYLRGRQYPHERIDGSVPGDQRQAAIDRFSTLPIDQSFVFLLCTRAGGVGINLTVSPSFFFGISCLINEARVAKKISLGCRYMYYFR